MPLLRATAKDIVNVRTYFFNPTDASNEIGWSEEEEAEETRMFIKCPREKPSVLAVITFMKQKTQNVGLAEQSNVLGCQSRSGIF